MSGTGTPRAERGYRAAAGLPAQAGFTLLEVMIVVLIIGVMATLAVLSVGSSAVDDRLAFEARRLNQLLLLASDEALQQGTEHGFLQTPQGYAFLVLGPDGQWAPPESGPLRRRDVEEPLQLELSIEGRPVVPLSPDAETELIPQVLLLSSGEATPFTLDLRARGHAPYFRLEGDALGRITLERRSPET